MIVSSLTSGMSHVIFSFQASGELPLFSIQQYLFFQIDVNPMSIVTDIICLLNKKKKETGDADTVWYSRIYNLST